MSQKTSFSGLRPSRGAMRLMVGSMLLAVAAVAVQPSFARGGDHHGRGMDQGEMFGGGGGRHMGRMLDLVDASEAQRAEIKKIHEAAAVDMKALRDSGRGLRERGRQLMLAPGAVDRGAAESLRLEMLALHDKMSKRRLDTMLAVADVLTPEQRAKIGEVMAKRGERMRDRMENRRGDAAPKS